MLIKVRWELLDVDPVGAWGPLVSTYCLPCLLHIAPVDNLFHQIQGF